MINILFAAKSERWDEYEAPLRAALDAHSLSYSLGTDMAPAEVDYIVYAPNSDVQDFAPYTRLKAVLNLWAGVENVVGNETLKVPLTRMVDEGGLTQGMIEWVTGHVLRHHLGMDAHIVNPDHIWDATPPPVSADRPVTILGLGTLGSACGQALAHLGFPVTGWSRSPKQIDGITSRHGEAGLLIMVEFFGAVGMGAQRWIDLGFMRLQPSEVMKIALVMLLAAYYDWLPLNKTSRPLWVLLPVVLILAPTLLVLTQPDLGTALLLMIAGGVMMFLAGVHLAYFATVIGAGVGAVWLVFYSRGKDWQLLKGYQYKRIDTFRTAHQPTRLTSRERTARLWWRAGHAYALSAGRSGG